jgi:hypothetical protein
LDGGNRDDRTIDDFFNQLESELPPLVERLEQIPVN